MLDANQDNFVTLDDSKPIFEKMDTDKSGFVNKTEFESLFKPVLFDFVYQDALSDPLSWKKQSKNETRTLFDVLDTNSDGNISATEIATVYQVIDVNEDAVVSKKELVSFLRKNERQLRQPYQDRISTGLIELNKQTHQSI
jgi:Ca2+-binding EF-hand superfamily protein